MPNHFHFFVQIKAENELIKTDTFINKTTVFEHLVTLKTSNWCIKKQLIMKNEIKFAIENLRLKAEELMIKTRSTNPSAYQSVNITEVEILKLIHELEVHQIELKMQNEEIALAKNQAEIVSEKYIGLYDFAPSGYFTLSKEGQIIELNLSGSLMLGKERSLLKNSSFIYYIATDTKEIFNNFLEKIFINNTKETCEVAISTYGKSPIYVHLTGIATKDDTNCIINAIDITERKQSEQELLEKMEELLRFQNLTVGRELAMIELKKEVNELLKKLGQEEKYVIVNE